MSDEWQERINNNQCPVCGKHKNDWNRCVGWICCSTQCTDKYQHNVIYGWSQLKTKVFERDNYLCVKCGKKGNSSDAKGWQNNYIGLVADHIIPIAIGGLQWDISNIQTLCIPCDKIKTKQDHADIAKQRRIEKKIVNGQKTLKECGKPHTEKERDGMENGL